MVLGLENLSSLKELNEILTGLNENVQTLAENVQVLNAKVDATTEQLDGLSKEMVELRGSLGVLKVFKPTEWLSRGGK